MPNTRIVIRLKSGKEIEGDAPPIERKMTPEDACQSFWERTDLANTSTLKIDQHVILMGGVECITFRLPDENPF